MADQLRFQISFQKAEGIGRASLTGSSWRESREPAISGDNRIIDHSVTRRGQKVSSAFSYSI